MGNEIMKPFTNVAVVVFAVISLMHLLRLFFGWDITVNGWLVPIWFSVPGFLITVGLALMLRRESHKL